MENKCLNVCHYNYLHFISQSEHLTYKMAVWKQFVFMQFG